MEVVDDKHRRGFSTPVVMPSPQGPQLIAPTANWAISYDPESGQEIWRFRLPDGHALVPSPVFADDLVYVCSGYHQPELVAIDVTGQRESHTRQSRLVVIRSIAIQVVVFVAVNRAGKNIGHRELRVIRFKLTRQ